jgi:hypothetical protein
MTRGTVEAALPQAPGGRAGSGSTEPYTCKRHAPRLLRRGLCDLLPCRAVPTRIPTSAQPLEGANDAYSLQVEAHMVLMGEAAEKDYQAFAGAGFDVLRRLRPR